MKIAVLGGGNAAFAFAGHLATIGHEIYLYEDKKFESSVKAIAKIGRAHV